MVICSIRLEATVNVYVIFRKMPSCVLVGGSSNAITTHKRQKNKKSDRLIDRQMERRMDKACWATKKKFKDFYVRHLIGWLVGWSWRKVERCANLQIASTTVATDWWGWQSLIWGLKCIIWGLRGLIRSLGGFFSCRHKLYQWRCRSACLSIHQSVGLLVQGHQVEKWDNKCFRCNLCMFVCVGWGLGVGVWMGVGCPCPPIRNIIMTQCHLF